MASQKNASTDQFKHRMSVQAEPRILQQKKAFTGWVNAHLQQRSMDITNLEDISQVSPLIHLLEILEKNPLDKITKHHKKPRNNFDKMEGMIICLTHIKSREGSNVNPFDAETLLAGKELKIYLALIWRIIVTYGIQGIQRVNDNNINNDNNNDNNINEEEQQEQQEQQPQKQKKKVIKSAEDCLKEWVNTQLITDKLEINNFTTDWIDGKILICLMNKALHKNNEIKYSNIEHMSNKQLLDHILAINHKYLNIPQLLDSNSLINSPNKEAVMTYVLLLKTAIENYDENEYESDNVPDEKHDIENENKNENKNANNNENDVMEQFEVESKEKETAGGDSDSDSDSGEDNSSNNVDLCILCDVTDSMKPWIDEIKNGIGRIINQLKNTFGIGKLRLSFIGYRDWDDNNNNSGEKRIEKLEFINHSNSIVYFESFVENIAPVGGGDAAEDVLGGIQEVLKLKWKAPIRVLYHICDAPAHGTMYHNYFEKLVVDEEEYINDEMAFLDGISDDSDSDDDKSDGDDELLVMEGNDDEDRVNDIDKEREEKLLRDEYDKWPNKYPQDPSHEDLFLEMKNKNILYFLGTQTKFTDKMVNVFKTYCDSIEYSLTTMDLYNVSQLLPTLIAAVEYAVRIVIPPQNSDDDDFNLQDLYKKKRRDFKVYCGIDFGTAGSGFAYSLPGKNEVYTDQNWNDNGKHVDVKTKTNILLDIKGNCIAFGDDATDKYTHTDTNDLFFERFKMALYNKKQQEIDEKKQDICEYLTAANGQKLPSRKVLEEAIRFMKEHAMNNLRKNVNKNLQIEDIQWILTVPAIWSDSAKSIMKTAAITAGMINPSMDDQLIIAYEPDCASLSILNEINEKARAIANNNGNGNEFDSYFNCGDKILLCDLGGGTADIACHELDENERIRQIVAPSGGAWGSTYVDQYFLYLLDDIFGKKWMQQFKIEEPSKYIDFLTNFRDSKKTYRMNEKEKIRKKEYDNIFHNVKVPFTFLDFIGEKVEEENEDENDDDDDDEIDDLEKIVNNFVIFKKKGLIKLNDEYLEISYTVWNYLFDQVINCIITHCKKLLNLNEMNGCRFLCLVGGFSESKYLQTKFYTHFGSKSSYDILIFTPKRPILSVVDGAARMGLKPDFISARTIANTYGIAIQKDLEEFKQIYPNSMWEKLIPKAKVGKRLTYSEKDQSLMKSIEVVNDIFLPFVRKNQLIKNNDKAIVYWVEPADIKSKIISVRLFSSDEINPIFVDDSKEANKIDIELNEMYKLNKKPIPIRFIFNDTTIRVFVTMINQNGQKETKEISVNFDVVR